MTFLSESTPIRLVVGILGLVLMASVLGIIGLAVTGTRIPDVLGTVAIASMTGLTGLLTPNTGLRGGHVERQAAVAGQAAAAAVVEHQGLAQLAKDATELDGHRRRRDTPPGP